MPASSHRARPASVLKTAIVIRDGGGTARVELTVAGKLRERGHEVTVFGPPEVRDETENLGFDLEQLDWAASTNRAPEDLMPRMIAAAVPWARHLTPIFQGRFDLVAADCTAFGALMAARISKTRSVGIMPTVYVAGAPVNQTAELRAAWGRALTGINRARKAVGLDPVFSVTEQILDADRLLVLTSRAFELPEVLPPSHVRYVGPQLPQASGATYQAPAGTGPLVLVSLSTSEQNQLPLLNRIVFALGSLPLRALVTVGPTLDPATLNAPPNVSVERFVPHDAVLPHAALVVTHAGHGTVLAATSAGVPLVCLPMGRDQPAVAMRATRHGLGVSLDPDAGADAIRAAITQVLNDPSYRAAAQRLAGRIEPADRVVTEVEAAAAG